MAERIWPSRWVIGSFFVSFVQNLRDMSLVTVGTVAFDSIHTPYGGVERVIGGACTYISWSASYFTDDIKLVSIVGEDFPQNEIQALNDRGVNTDGLEIVPGAKSFFWEGRYHDDMNSRDTLVTELNVLAQFDPVLPESYVASLYFLIITLSFLNCSGSLIADSYF